MKRNDVDFSVPHRQSYAAIVMILGRSLNIVLRQLFPVFIVVFLGSSQNRGPYLIYVGLATAVITLTISIINFFVTYFYIKDDELILHTGVFQKKKTAIPFDRIQSVNFEQNIFHTLFNVVKINIDSAGSDKNEFEFHAIDKTIALSLRDTLMEGQSERIVLQENLETDTNRVNDVKIFSLSITDLLKAGFTENHIKSGGVIIFFFFWIYSNLQEAGVEVDEYSDNIDVEAIGGSLLGLLIFLFLVVSVGISLFKTVIKNFNLSLYKSQDRFKIHHGLLTRRETAAKYHKIQYLTWSDNLLKKIIGFYNLYIHQAASNQLKLKQNIFIPGVQTHHIEMVADELYGSEHLENMELKNIDPRYFYRMAVIYLLLGGALSFVLYYFSSPVLILYVVIVLGFLMLNRFLGYHKKKYGYNTEMLHIKGGIYGDKNTIMPLYKIQATEIRQSPYQWRNHLCSVVLYTASGNLIIPYIALSEGYRTVNYITYKIESVKKPWM